MAEQQISHEERETDGGGAKENAAAGTKRQRRPSVRLGDIGGGGGDAQHFYYTDHQTRRRATKQPAKTQPLGKSKSSKQTLVNDNDNDNDDVNVNVNNNRKHKKKSTSSCSGKNENNEKDDDDFGDGVAIGSWRNKAKVLISKRVAVNGKGARSNSVSKSNRNQRGSDEINRNFEPIHSEEVEEDQEQDQQELDENASPVTSSDNSDDDNVDDYGVERERDNGVLKFDGRRKRVRVLDEMEGPSDSSERNGVKDWLNKLGLGQYAPVFEIHEVDDQVLPMLTLDDLKDMGINAVGSRRKMYCSIQTLKKGLS